MDYKKEAGRRLKAARHKKGWSLAELSKKIGGFLSPSRLSNYEQGLRMLGIKESLALGVVLGVQPSHLLCVDGEEEDMTSQEIDLLRNFRALPEKDRNEYARRIEVLALVYLDPLPDERLPAELRKGARRLPHRTKK